MKWQWARHLTAREKIMLQVLAVVAFLTLTTVYVILPLITQSGHLDEQIAKTAQANSRLMAQVRNEHEMDSELVTTLQKLERLAVQLPIRKEIPQFIVLLEQAAAVSGVRLRELRLGDPVDKKTHGEIPIDLSLAGEYLSLVQFVKQLETMPRQSRSSQWRIAATSGTQLEMQLSMVIFLDPRALLEPNSDTLQSSYPIGRPNPFSGSVTR